MFDAVVFTFAFLCWAPKREKAISTFISITLVSAIPRQEEHQLLHLPLKASVLYELWRYSSPVTK